MKVAAVQQVKTAIGENSLLAFRSCLGADCLQLLDGFELSGHTQMGNMSNAGFQLEVPVIQGQSMS
jgi:hypothetical protein